MELIFVLFLLLVAFAVVLCRFLEHRRLWARQCPQCGTLQPHLDDYNRCEDCGCEYDRRRRPLEDLSPPKLDNLDLDRFHPKGNNSEPSDEHCQPGSSQELTP
jgi:hypothetical protein